MLHQFKNINTIVLDVDGVLTDGTLLIMPGGLMVRRMNIKDGYALQLAVKKGYHIAVISGGDSAEVKDRLQKLGITDVYMKVHDKLAVLKSDARLFQQHQISKEEGLKVNFELKEKRRY